MVTQLPDRVEVVTQVPDLSVVITRVPDLSVVIARMPDAVSRLAQISHHGIIPHPLFWGNRLNLVIDLLKKRWGHLAN